jgi:hypothetical protein
MAGARRARRPNGCTRARTAFVALRPRPRRERATAHRTVPSIFSGVYRFLPVRVATVTRAPATPSAVRKTVTEPSATTNACGSARWTHAARTRTGVAVVQCACAVRQVGPRNCAAARTTGAPPPSASRRPADQHQPGLRLERASLASKLDPAGRPWRRCHLPVAAELPSMAQPVVAPPPACCVLV